MKEDVTYNVLAHFVQRDDASMDKIVTALKNIKRYDIITRLKNILIDFGERLNEQYKVTNNEFLKPDTKIAVPLVLSGPGITDLLFQAPKLPPNIPPKYPAIVLFTYTTESEEIAYLLATQLRMRKIGVIILEEHKDLVRMYGEKFVFDAISQSDFVIPILTTDYLNKITSLSNLRDFSLWENIDNTYVKYIYKMLMTHYMQNSCYNTKIRGIIPHERIKDVLNHEAMKYKAELSVWRSSKDIDAMGDLILSKR